MSPRPVEPRLPYVELERAMGPMIDRIRGERLGVTMRTLLRWRADGNLGLPSAEACATALGLHPSAIWGPAYSDAVAEDDRRRAALAAAAYRRKRERNAARRQVRAS